MSSSKYIFFPFSQEPGYMKYIDFYITKLWLEYTWRTVEEIHVSSRGQNCRNVAWSLEKSSLGALFLLSIWILFQVIIFVCISMAPYLKGVQPRLSRHHLDLPPRQMFEREPGRGQGDIEQPSAQTGGWICQMCAVCKLHLAPFAFIKI